MKISVIYVSGELDGDAVPKFRDEMAALLAGSGADEIFLDLSELTFCDCAGLRAIEALGQDYADLGPVRVLAASEPVDLLLKALRSEPLLGYRPGAYGAPGNPSGR